MNGGDGDDDDDDDDDVVVCTGNVEYFYNFLLLQLSAFIYLTFSTTFKKDVFD